ncbi:DUF4398 domain-containing protein [Dokdonella fugitiva]|uniref:DUF4398 domain-containing protein n=1 Tax=Dokdonella fugitiva TaxID=328517 RepID=UPI0015F97F8F|nr:DUF4398 domain-containing protein [Dokdonella fugitiva]MBA8885216.1 hypothetical protein [Dokdonella fugitiva]
MSTPRLLFATALAASCSIAMAVDRDDAQLELAQAATAVQAAERDDAMRHAPADLDEAHATLAAAERAVDAREWEEAAWFAERAKVCGDLASARSRQRRAEAATDELQRSVDALRSGNGGVR